MRTGPWEGPTVADVIDLYRNTQVGVVDGDVLADLLADHTPPQWTVRAARDHAETVLAAMRTTGFTILRGPALLPWAPPPSTQDGT